MGKLFIVLLVAVFLSPGIAKGRSAFDSSEVSAIQRVIAQAVTVPRGNDSSIICNGRLTLTTATPITNADVTAGTTVYFTPYNGARLALYNSTLWQILAFTEVSVSVPSTTTTPFDIFAYNNSGTVALETVDWTDDSTRATALAMQDGVLVKAGAPTRRYLGTGRTTSVSGQVADSRANRFLVNYCNPVKRPLLTVPGYSDNNAVTTHNVTSTTWVEGNSGTAGRVNFLIPQLGWPVHVTVNVESILAAKKNFSGFGVDSVSTAKGAALGYATGHHSLPWHSGSLTPGLHYISLLEATEASSTAPFYSDGARRGSAADPYFGYVMGWISG